MTLVKTEHSTLGLLSRPFPEKQLLIVDSVNREHKGFCEVTNFVDYDTGLIKPISYLPITIVKGKGGFIAGKSLYSALANCLKGLEDEHEWRMKITNTRRRAYDRYGRMTITGVFQINYISFRNRYSGLSKKSNTVRWDIVNLENFFEASESTLEEMIQASLSILTLCSSRHVNFRGSRGSLSNLLLKSGPYWKGPNRKPAPKFINDFSRDYLPGNHYSVSDKVSIKPLSHCFYIDQLNAHHSIAASIHIPYPGFIRARGNYRGALEKGHYKKWLERIPINQAGLFLCRIGINTIPLKLRHLYPNWVIKRKPGEHFIWLWSPELRLFKNDHYLRFEYIVCGFSSSQHDLAITDYAEWSKSQLDISKSKAYIKPTLLAAYGMLAFNPTGYKSYRYWAGNEYSRGIKVDIPEVGTAKEVCVQLPNSVQASVTNVIARGLIEAETRTRSLELAKELNSQGYHIAQVYADALVVETDRLPFLPDNWRISHSLTNVRIPRPNAFISDQMIKMPGMTREESERRFRSRLPFLIAEASSESNVKISLEPLDLALTN